MFALAFSIGIFSYIVFLLGIFKLLYSLPIILASAVFWGGFVIWQRHIILNLLQDVKGPFDKLREEGFRNTFIVFSASKFGMINIILGLLLLQILVNLIGVFGPEISFDTLWYHLTLPKLFLSWHQVRHIPGGLLYYSDMPKLTEMLYIPGLVFLQETGAKLTHFFFGILCCLALYKLGRKFFSPFLSLIAVAIFYSNLVIGWESISAYIDLARTFFAILNIYAFFSWVETKQVKWLIVSALCVGLGIATKFLALMDVGIFVPLIVWVDWKDKKNMMRDVGVFILLGILVPSPWWVYSYVQTGNPFYPFFTPLYPTISSLNLNPLHFVSTIWTEFTHSADPLSPLYIAFLPFLILVKKWDRKFILLSVFGVLSIIIWYISPQTGGGRFLLAYLPVLSLLVVFVFQHLKRKYLQAVFIISLMVTLLISIGYRTIANAKFIPVIVGRETKAQFLQKHLNFSFGDWYDIDGYMASHIKSTDTVLLYGYHNLYYVDFPYIHESWVKKGDRFNYIATSGGLLPARFGEWKLEYQNSATHLHLYSDGGKVWIY